MKMICPVCHGAGVILELPKGLTIPQQSQADLVKHASKKLCPECYGDGEVETGYVARALGLKKSKETPPA